MSTRKNDRPVWVLWHGGGSYAAPYADQAETMPYGDVVSFMLDRYHNRDGFTPCVDESSRAHVFLSDPAKVTDPHPDEIVTWSDYHNTYRREAC